MLILLGVLVTFCVALQLNLRRLEMSLKFTVSSSSLQHTSVHRTFR